MTRFAVCCLAIAIALVSAVPALAATEQYCSGTFTGAGAYASTSAHSGVSNSHVNGPNTECPAVAAGYAGRTTSPNGGDNFTATGNCGSGDRIWYPNGTANYYFHGAFTYGYPYQAYINYARYTW